MAKMTPQSFLEIAGLPVTKSAVRKLNESAVRKMKEAPDDVGTWEIEGIPGDGRGSIFFNADEQFTDPSSGVVVTSWDGYDGDDEDEDEEWDDFGSRFYSCTVRGTKQQVDAFIDDQSYGDRSRITVDMV